MKKIILIAFTFTPIISFAEFIPQGSLNINKGEINLENANPPIITLTLKNSLNHSDSFSPQGTDPKYKVSSNRCLNVASNKTCVISLSPNRKLPIGPIQFSFAGFSISMDLVRKDINGNIITPTPLSADLSFQPSSQPNIQFLENDKFAQISFTIKNNGNAAVIPNSIGWLSNPSNAKILINRCNNLINPGRSCTMTVSFPAVSSNISQSLTVSYNGNNSPKSLTFNLKAYVPPVIQQFEVHVVNTLPYQMYFVDPQPPHPLYGLEEGEDIVVMLNSNQSLMIGIIEFNSVFGGFHSPMPNLISSWGRSDIGTVSLNSNFTIVSNPTNNITLSPNSIGSVLVNSQSSRQVTILPPEEGTIHLESAGGIRVEQGQGPLTFTTYENECVLFRYTPQFNGGSSNSGRTLNHWNLSSVSMPLNQRDEVRMIMCSIPNNEEISVILN